MNFQKSVLTLFLLAGLFFSCSKSDTTPTPTPVTPTYAIEGLWIGTYTCDQLPSVGSQYFSYIIKPDGTMLWEGKASTDQYIAKGTWNLAGTAFTSTVTNIYSTAGGPTNITQTSTATFNDTTAKLNTGVWQNTTGGATGKFTLTRVN